MPAVAAAIAIAPTERDIRALLERQARDWNAGDLAGYMEGYEKSERLRFHSGGDVTLGWQTVHDRYRKRYQDRAAMGRLTFSEVAVEPLGPEAAVVHGRWRLQRAQDEPSGLFTLLLRKNPEGLAHPLRPHLVEVRRAAAISPGLASGRCGRRSPRSFRAPPAG